MALFNENQIRLKAKVFYALSDHIRLEILEYLRSGEKCVCEITPYLNLLATRLFQDISGFSKTAD